MQSAGLIPCLLLASLGFIACGGGEEQPAQQPQQAPPGTYAPQQQPGYAQPAPAPAQPAPAPAPAQPGMAPAPAQPGAAQPAPGQPPQSQLGFPCQTDANCIASKCDTTAGRCIFPCQQNTDCQTGYKCMAPLCLPGQ